MASKKLPKPAKLLIFSQLFAFFFEIYSMYQTGYFDLKVQYLLYISTYIFLAINISNNDRGKKMVFSTIAVCVFFLLDFELNTDFGVFPFLQSLTTLILMLGLVFFALKNVGIQLFVKLHPLVLKFYKISIWVNIILTLSLSLESFSYYDYDSPILLLVMLGTASYIYTKIAVYKAGLLIASVTAQIKTKERTNVYIYDIEPMDMKAR